jgi:hypothetical protein
VFSFQRGVLWRRPQWYSAVRYVAILPRWVREVCCQTTYVIAESVDSCFFNARIVLSEVARRSSFFQDRI